MGGDSRRQVPPSTRTRLRGIVSREHEQRSAHASAHTGERRTSGAISPTVSFPSSGQMRPISGDLGCSEHKPSTLNRSGRQHWGNFEWFGRRQGTKPKPAEEVRPAVAESATSNRGGCFAGQLIRKTNGPKKVHQLKRAGGSNKTTDSVGVGCSLLRAWPQAAPEAECDQQTK